MTSSLTPIADDSATAANTLDTDNAAIELAAQWNGPRCEKCDAPMKSEAVTVCRRCGWYASLGQFVEVDQDWEAYGDDDQQPVEAAKPSHLEVWLNLLPRWAWIVIAIVTAVVVESIIVRLALPEGSSFRTTWSLTQLAVGIMVFLGCHLFTFLMAVADDADTGALDIVLRPLKLWIQAFRELPRRQWATDVAAAGLTAALMSIVVIGSLPYERLWDWGFEQPADQNLMGAVMSQANKVKGRGADSLEGAIGDFAGSQNLEELSGQPAPPPKPREKVDCVILGYRLDAEGRLSSLILGTAYRKQLVYAGAVTPKLTDEEESELLTLLAAEKTDESFLTVQTSAIWVKPKLTCRVSYVKRLESGRLEDPQWEALLSNIQLE